MEEVRNLAWALNWKTPDTSMPSLAVIAEPPLDPCYMDTFETLNQTTGLPVINVPAAEKVAAEENATGADEEIYDFFLMLKSDLMKGWTLPPNLLTI